MRFGQHSPCQSCLRTPGTLRTSPAQRGRAGRVGALAFPPSSVLGLRTSEILPLSLVTHLAAVMGLGHQQHAANEVRGGHTLGAFALSGDRGGDRWDGSSQFTPPKGNPAPGCAVHRPVSPHCSRLRQKPGPGGWGRPTTFYQLKEMMGRGKASRAVLGRQRLWPPFCPRSNTKVLPHCMFSANRLPGSTDPRRSRWPHWLFKFKLVKQNPASQLHLCSRCRPATQTAHISKALHWSVPPVPVMATRNRKSLRGVSNPTPWKGVHHWGSPIPPSLLHFLIGVPAVYGKRDVI